MNEELESREVWCPVKLQMVKVEASIEFESLPKLTVLACREQHVCKHFKRGECRVGMVLTGRW